MWVRIAAPLLLLFVVGSHVPAMSLQLVGAEPSLPFEVTCRNDGMSPCGLLLQLVNDSEDVANVLAWQLEMELHPLDGAQGNLLFHGVEAATVPLFDSVPQLLSTLPSDIIGVIDADPAFVGLPIPPNTPRNIVQMILETDLDTIGRFALVMVPFNSGNDSGSSWFGTGDPPTEGFNNSTQSIFSDRVLLGIITVVPEPSGMELLLMGGFLVATACFAKRRLAAQGLPGGLRRDQSFTDGHERQLDCLADVELFHDARLVVFNGVGGQLQRLRTSCDRTSLGQELKYLYLAR